MTDIETQIRNAVWAFDSSGTGIIDDQGAVLAIRSLGYDLNDKEQTEITHKVGSGKSAAELIELVKPLAKTKGSPRDQILAHFKQFDRAGDGTITRKELAEILRTLGEVLSEPEQNALCDICAHGGRIQYTKLVDTLLSDPN